MFVSFELEIRVMVDQFSLFGCLELVEETHLI